MKNILLFLIIFCGTFLFAQEKTLSSSELDSLNPINEPKVLEVIENVPLYKGCKKNVSNGEKKKCMSQNIALHFQKHFNTEMHEESELIPGLKRVLLTFKVDKEGKVTGIQARAEDEYLEAEAIRVAKLIPPLTPGFQRGKPVIVPYTLPLMVNIEPNKNEGLTKYPVYRGCNKTSSNADLEACSKRKIANFIKMSFDIELASRALPTEKSTQFLLEFTINKKGKIENVNTKANHKAIAIEAIKVAKRLPKFKEPGYWEGVAVETPYSLLMTLYFN
ncbi:energy transducer TonB [Psychroserpens sp.]|uniref:energy transducer TonB n=1 Tax=Psychroserpens sp. TaxID=2020870 RepID=UPI002B27489F|nr:energy transducer TonB [Psychroserpens sp.]